MFSQGVGIVFNALLFAGNILFSTAAADLGSASSPNTAQSSLTSFKVCDVIPRNVSLSNLHLSLVSTSKPYHIAEDLDLYKKGRCTDIIQGTFFSPDTTFASNNGFVYTLVEAYNQHHNVILRPDDVWMAIMTQFSFYVNAHAEEFRGQFVRFNGTKELTVGTGGTLRSVSYANLVLSMEKEIHAHLLDDEVRGWIMPNFTTTTESDRVSSGVVFMASMKKYFTYKFSIMCGLPRVSLDGALADWQDIRRRLEKLEAYGLTEWATMLRPILDQFVQAKAGDVEEEFWARVAHFEGGGSGPTYLSGWITAFCLFNKDGQRQGRMVEGREWPRIDTDDIPSGVVEVDVTIDDNGVEYKTTMLAGSMAQEIGADGMTLQPRAGWIIAFKDPEPSSTPLYTRY